MEYFGKLHPNPLYLFILNQLFSEHVSKQKFKPKNVLFLLQNSKNRRAIFNL